MSKSVYTVIKGTGSYIPPRKVKNSDFLKNEFYQPNGNSFSKSNHEITQKLKEITDITERRYVTDDLVTSDIAYFAAENALKSSGIDGETLDYIIVAHNFGDIAADNRHSDFVPALASRVKHKLGIQNPGCIPYDLPFGCPGWLQGMIQANYYIKSGDAKRVMIIGSETLSRISDPHDRDCMIYSDGAGATIVEALESDEEVGILTHAVRNDSIEQAFMLRMAQSFNPEYDGDEIYLKMDGHKLYQYALRHVPQVVKDSIDKAGLSINDINKVLIHQANAKMDEAILRRTFSLYDIRNIPDDIMPMTISWLGNSSVATVPTLLDLISKDKLDGHHLHPKDNIILASVGAGMNINSVVYRVP
jgi:3-oxoacyl-[acyl-carrier-protein] synthase-3